MKIESEDSIKMQNMLQKTKSERVLEKWENEGEIHKDSIRKAASEYAKLEVNNKILKWIIVGVVTLLFVLLGFMIASVVLGVQITKEVTVKNGVLVSRSGEQAVVKTSSVKYYNKITLNSPSTVIDSLTSISVTLNEGLYSGVLQFDVVSYVFVPGKQLTFYGHTHVANIQPDGSVSIQSLVPTVGSRTTSGDTVGTSVAGTSSSTGQETGYTIIDTCDKLAAITASGLFKITTNLNCPNLALPLLAGQRFIGTIHGQGNTVTVSAVSTGPIGLFDQFQGVVTDLEIEGSLAGVGQCGGFGVQVFAGAFLSKASSYAHITCTPGTNGQNAAGSLFAIVQPGNEGAVVTFHNTVSQGTITYNDVSARVGGVYGFSNSVTTVSVFNIIAVDNTFITTGQSSQFGFLQGEVVDCQKESNICLTGTGLAQTQFDCCYGYERTPNLPNDLNCNARNCFFGRDTSSRKLGSTKKNTQSRVIESSKVTPNYQV